MRTIRFTLTLFSAIKFVQVKWLSDIGLAPADVRAVFSTYPPFLRLSLDAMVGGISFLGAELDLSPQEIAKVQSLAVIGHALTREARHRIFS